jgi:hypothetical protein
VYHTPIEHSSCQPTAEPAMADLTIEEQMELARQERLIKRMVLKLTSVQMSKGFWQWRCFDMTVRAEENEAYVYELLGTNTKNLYDADPNRDNESVQRCVEWVNSKRLLPENMNTLQVEFFSSHILEIIHCKSGENIFEDHDGSSLSGPGSGQKAVIWTVLSGEARVKCREDSFPRVQKNPYVVLAKEAQGAFRNVNVQQGGWITPSSVASLPNGTGAAVRSKEVTCVPGVSASATEGTVLLAISRTGFSGSFGVYFDSENANNTAMRIISSMPEFRSSWDAERVRSFLRRNVEVKTLPKGAYVETEQNTMCVLCTGECQVLCKVKNPANGRKCAKTIATIASPGSIMSYSRVTKEMEEEQKTSVYGAQKGISSSQDHQKPKLVVRSTAQVLIIKLRAIDGSTLNRIELSIKRIETGRSLRLSQILETMAALGKESSLAAAKRRRLSLLNTSNEISNAKKDFNWYKESVSSWKSEVDRNLKQTLDKISTMGTRGRRHSHKY